MRGSRRPPSGEELETCLGGPGVGWTRLGGSTSEVWAARRPFVVVCVQPRSVQLSALTSRLDFVRAAGRALPWVRLWGQGLVRLDDGRHATVWHRERVQEPGRSGPVVCSGWEDLGRTVAQLHGMGEPGESGLRIVHGDGLDDEAPMLSGLGQDAREALSPALRHLRSAFAETDPAAGRALALVHGDLHLGNVLRTDRGPVLCDLDELAVGDPRRDLGSLLDPGRRRAPGAADLAHFRRGYGDLPSAQELRLWALASHLRRTVVLEQAASTVRERAWCLARRTSWRKQAQDWSALVVPLVDRSRPRHLQQLSDGAWRALRSQLPPTH